MYPEQVGVVVQRNARIYCVTQRQDLLRDATRRGGDSGHLPVFSPYIAQDIGFIHGLTGAFRRRWSDHWRGWRTGTAAEDRHAQCQRQG
ncbi:hypothetical protein VC35_01295 [Pseudomonas fluorescens]|uniref:Uncharacterized protein n=1 Tax=Pseudomonas fluorescens TaxID=294 RepID=A0A0F4U243_PSEFL|nr:hypothetical protein VC35_01295 [Pseudomonas fluorescens]